MGKKYSNCIKILIFILSIIYFNACVNKNISIKHSYSLLLKTKKIKFNDAVFLQSSSEHISINALSLGKSMVNITINNQYDICLNYICYGAKEFNKKFLSDSYEDKFLDNIFRTQPIFYKRNLKKTKDGFMQNIGYIKYKKTNNSILFKDKKNNITIKLTRI